jgi:hypothetical protein
MDQNFTGKDLCGWKGIEIYYNKRMHSFSTSELRQRVIHAEEIKLIKK